jgi:alpha-N-acetylglucosaminidase
MALFLLCALFFARAAADPVSSATGLLSRLLGPAAVNLFQLEAIPSDPATGLDVFEMDAAGSRVVLRGNTGVAISTALNNYLKYVAHSKIAQSPKTPPLPPPPRP